MAPSSVLRMKIFSIIITLTAALIAGCTYYQTTPGVYSTTATTSKFDQSWSAAVGALSDQGVRITSQDRGAGIVQGTRNGIKVTGSIRTQADGSVRVQFNTSGATNRDPMLIERITGSYNSRMGR
jgi:hypothetical protein